MSYIYFHLSSSDFFVSPGDHHAILVRLHPSITAEVTVAPARPPLPPPRCWYPFDHRAPSDADPPPRRQRHPRRWAAWRRR